MANKSLGATMSSLVEGPCDSADILYEGDFVWWDKTNSKFEKASDQVDQGDEPANQVLMASRIGGHVWRPAPDGETTVVVDVGELRSRVRVTVPAGVYRLFTLLGPSENSGGDGLLDQQLEAVTLLEEATHIVMDDSASSREKVQAAQIRSVANPITGQVSQGIIDLPMFTWQEQDGTALAQFAGGASNTPGYSLTDAELLGIRWNNAAAPDPIGRSFLFPPDADLDKDMTVHVLASKTGATVGDATTFDVTIFNTGVVGALHDADADYGGTTGALTGDAAAKTVQHVELTLAAADLPDAFPAGASITLQPTDGTLGTDDIIVHAVWIEYTKKTNG